MICCQSYNIKSPLNGEAARWTENNVKRLPLDTADLSPRIRPEEIVVRRDCLRFDATDSEGEKALAQDAQQDVKVRFPEAAPAGFTALSSAVRCANFKTMIVSTQIQNCCNGHVVCSDCIIECPLCGKHLCVLCPLEKCSGCGTSTCAECRSTCTHAAVPCAEMS